MGEIIEQLKGFGGYTTTASIWLIAFITWWRGLPGLILAVDKIVDAIANRQSKVEERMTARLVDADRRYDESISLYEKRLAAEIERHTECMEGQDAMRAEISELRATLDSFKRQWGGIATSATRIEGREVPQMIADAATRAAEAIAQPRGPNDATNND